MNFFLFINKSDLDNIKKNGIAVTDCYHGKGVLLYPEKEINFKTFSSDSELKEDEKIANKLSIYEKWKKTGTLGITQDNGTVFGIKAKLTDSHWPLKVFIDVQSKVLKEFEKLLYKTSPKEIDYGDRNKLNNYVNKTDFSSDFVLEMSFKVSKNTDLEKLMDLFIKAGGGIWGAHSFDCLINKDISPNLILEIIEH